MVKLIAADMDGTLLNLNGQVSERTGKYIKEFQAQGGHFAVCTGRDYHMSTQPLEDVGVSCDFICSSGASIIKANGEPLREIIFDLEMTLQLAKIFESYGFYMELFTSEGRMTPTHKEEAIRYFKEEWPDTQVKGGIIHTYERTNEIAEFLLETTSFGTDITGIFNKGVKVYKINTASMDVDKINQLKKECQGLGFVAESSFIYNAELTLPGAQKGIAVEFLAQQYLVDKEDIMVLGDSDNDRSMMEKDFGYCVAMANASEEIKKLSSHETLSNEEDGVAEAIIKYALK